VVPAVTLGAALSAILARMARASVLEKLRELSSSQHERGACRATARCYGAVLRHAFTNGLIRS
jgi:ABC-type dipeptide/oligopeptide/nickel transport system permease component